MFSHEVITALANTMKAEFADKQYEKKADKLIVADKTYTFQKNGTPDVNKITIKYCETNNQPYALYVDKTQIFYDESACYTWYIVFKGTAIALDPSKFGYTDTWHVYWGDGTSDEGGEVFFLTHTYTDGKEEHTIRVDVPFTSLGNETFRDRMIKHITFPDICTCIGETAFKDDTALRTVTFPPALTTIKESAFEGCVENDGGLILMYNGLSEIELPNTVKTIEKNAFKGCYAIHTIVFGSALETIGEGAFDMTGMSGGLLTNAVTFKNPTPPVCGVNAFKNFNTDFLTVRVPYGSLDAYKNTPNMLSGDNIFWMEYLP